ncbi:hypothetical protein ACF081_10520 [Streptomyces longwoodensis]|uniref:hypothetical protein n=1 Tax=Streptomyces longwoodensis TaxID=68231 RepID=UPI0036F9C20C
MPLAEQTLVKLRLRGQGVQAAITVIQDEAFRRSSFGLGAVESRALLTTLYALPVDVPVPRSTLDHHTLRTLFTAPRGVVDLDAWEQGSVVRRLVPAVRVELVLVHGPDGISSGDWDAAVRDASQFAPFCSRGVVLSSPTPERGSGPDMDLLLLKARFYGVGVVQYELSKPPRWLLEPAPHQPERHSAAQWLFHEQAWGQLGPDFL